VAKPAVAARLRQADAERSWVAFWEAFDDPDPERRARASIIAGKLLRDLGDFDAAQRAYRRATSSGHTTVVADGWNLLGEVLRLSHDYPGASEAYENAINAGVPRIASKAAYNRGVLLWDENKPEAEGVFRAAMSANDPDVPAWAACTLGRWLAEHGRVEDAQDAYRAAIAFDHPGASPEALIALAELLTDRGENREAEEFLMRATEYPEPADRQSAWLELGRLRALSGDIPAALQALEACAGGSDSRISATSALMRAQLLAGRADTRDGGLTRELLQEAVQNGNTEEAAAASYQLGILDLGAERHLDALVRFAISVRAVSSSAAMVDLGLLIRHHGAALSEESMQAVAGSGDPSARAWGLRTLGDLQASVGANDAAIKTYRAAFELKTVQSELAGAALAVRLAVSGNVPAAEKVVDELNGWESWTRVERALLDHGMGRIDDEQLRSVLNGTQLLALGQDPPDEEGSDLLHFTVDGADGQERAYLPLFTRLDVMHDALVRNPTWFGLSVLEVEAEVLMSNIDEDVTAVLNPWSVLEVALSRVPEPQPTSSAG
jgi:tetratricopeptide (TPR) repeat protein